MTGASNDTASDPVVAGWGELRGAHWEAARELFQTALAVEETPEALGWSPKA